jgi:hypothetical protein
VRPSGWAVAVGVVATSRPRATRAARERFIA